MKNQTTTKTAPALKMSDADRAHLDAITASRTKAAQAAAQPRAVIAGLSPAGWEAAAAAATTSPNDSTSSDPAPIPAALLYAPDLAPDAVRALSIQATRTALTARPLTPFIQLLSKALTSIKHKPDPAALAEAMSKAEDAQADAAALATEADAEAHDLTRTEEERAEAAQLYDIHHNRAESAKGEAADIRAILFSVAHDAADIVSAAQVQYYTTLTTPADIAQYPKLLEAYGYPEEEQPTDPKTNKHRRRNPEERAAIMEQRRAWFAGYKALNPTNAAEIQNRANYKSMINAAAAALESCRSLNALDSWHTDIVPATPAEIARWIANHGKIINPHESSSSSADNKKRCKDEKPRDEIKGGGYITIEAKQATSRRPAGIYKVIHRRTVKAAQSLEDGNTYSIAAIDSDILTALDISTARSRAAYLEAVIQAAKLPARPRAWIAAYCSPAAQSRAAAAYDEYMRHCRKLDANRRAAAKNAAHAAAVAYADKALSLSPAAAQKLRQRLYKRLKEAAQHVRRTDIGKARAAQRTDKHMILTCFANRQESGTHAAPDGYTMPQDISRPCWIQGATIKAKAPDPAKHPHKLDIETATRDYFINCSISRLQEIDRAEASSHRPGELEQTARLAAEHDAARSRYCWRMIAYHGNSTARAYLGKQTPAALVILAGRWQPLADALQAAQKAYKAAMLDTEAAQKLYDKNSSRANLYALKAAENAQAAAAEAVTEAGAAEAEVLKIK